MGHELAIAMVVVDRATVGGDPTVPDKVPVIKDVAGLPLPVNLLDHPLERIPGPLALRIQVHWHRGHASTLQDGLIDPEDEGVTVDRHPINLAVGRLGCSPQASIKFIWFRLTLGSIQKRGQLQSPVILDVSCYVLVARIEQIWSRV